MGADQILTGQTLSFTADPFDGPWEDAVRHERRGAVLIRDGQIVATGPEDKVRAQAPSAKVTAYGDGLIMAGFVAAHAHYPQTAIIAS